MSVIAAPAGPVSRFVTVVAFTVSLAALTEADRYEWEQKEHGG